jgi:AraC-like DNA-binding protein
MPVDPFSVPVSGYRPVLAVSAHLAEAIESYTFDWATITMVRSGSALITGPHGSRVMVPGDVVVLVSGATVSIEPRDFVTVGMVAMDRDWLADMVFWRHADVFDDRFQAQRHVDHWRRLPVRFGRLTAEQAAALNGCIDELAALNGTHSAADDFFRAQIEVFAILEVLAVVFGLGTPSLPTPRRSPAQAGGMSVPRRRALMMVRPAMQQALELMREHPAERWTVDRLAIEVHMSPSQFAHVFPQTFGKSPIITARHFSSGTTTLIAFMNAHDIPRRSRHERRSL